MSTENLNLPPLAMSVLKEDWERQKQDQPLHRYFAVYGDLPFGRAWADQESIWTDVITYSRRQDDPRKAIKELPGKLGLDPWQLCGAMPLYIDDSPRKAARRISNLFYKENGSTGIPSLTFEDFLKKATSHFESIEYLDVEMGMERFPRTLGELVRICRKRLGITQQQLAIALNYEDQDAISLIENDVNGIPLKKVDKFIRVLGLEGKNIEIFYDLAGHLSVESCKKQMEASSQLEDFIRFARERLRMHEEELKEIVKCDISAIENGYYGIALQKIDVFVKALKLSGKHYEKLYTLSGHRSPEACNKAMEKADNVGDFVKAAREKIRKFLEELAQTVGYKDGFSIAEIESNNHGIPIGKIDQFVKALRLSKQNEIRLYNLTGHPSPETCTQTMGVVKTAGEFLVAARIRSRISQYELAALVGYKNRSSIVDFERNRRDTPLEKLDLFAEVLNLDSAEKERFKTLILEVKKNRLSKMTNMIELPERHQQKIDLPAELAM